MIHRGSSGGQRRQDTRIVLVWNHLSIYTTPMRITAPLIVLALALCAAAFSFLSDDGFSRLSSLTKSLEQQQRTNVKLEESVQALKRQVNGLQNDARIVEKAARSELGMARSDEIVVVFEKKEQARGEGK